MNPTELLQPILTDGIASVNFFNGRLLSGEDLTKEQQANRTSHRLLGQAIGAGVACGLEVARADGAGNKPILTIQPGLALNRKGETVRLAAKVDVALVQPTENSGAVGNDSPFSACSQLQQPGVYVKDAGIYLLTIAPAWGREGRAPVSGLNNNAVDCNTKYLVEGVRFQLHQLDIKSSAADEPKLRNLVAAKCFGVGTDFFSRYPFSPAGNQYGFQTLNFLPALTECEVPLGIIRWAANRIAFVDMWSVRRRLARRVATDKWALAMDDWRVSEAEAMFLQFQEHIEGLRDIETNTAALKAEDHFNFLPPTGLLPLKAPTATAGGLAQVFRLASGNTSQSAGFEIENFFGAHASRDLATLDAAQYRNLLHQSFYHEPIELIRAGRLQLYLLWENLQAVERGTAQQIVLIFASAALPYFGTSRFGRAKWDISRVAPAVI